MTPKNRGFLYWAPRALGILWILFLALFSLDVFEPGRSFWEIAVGLFMHNIPALVMLLVLVIAWKRELVGAVAFCLVGVLYTVLTVVRGSVPWFIVLSWSITIAGPALLTGILFFLGWRRKRQRQE